MSETRIDKWLWAVRVFKTRTAAADACRKGRVSMGDGSQAKPSRMVKEGDTVCVRRPPVTYTFKVVGIPGSRVGAKLVSQFMENLTPKSQLDLLDVMRVSGFVDRRKGLGRPTKREGRELQQFAMENNGEDVGWDFDFDADDKD